MSLFKSKKRVHFSLKKFAPDVVNYSKAKFLQDLGAGLTVGIVALPLSLALAIATGVPPILGLYTAGIAGFLAAGFAGSAYSVSGPAAAMVPILAAIIQQHGLSNLPYITILAALFLFTFALIGLGKFIRKVPESVVLGFTAGIAVVILFGQLNNFLGLQGIEAHHHFAENAWETIRHAIHLHIPTVIIGGVALAVILLGHHIPGLKKIPATLPAMVLTTLLVMLVPFFGDVTTLGAKYGELPMGFPQLNFAPFSLDGLLNSALWFPALQVASLIAIESLLCAVVADRMTKTRHNSNQELVAQGIGNLGSALFGGIPATAVIARTGTIIKNNAASRVASIIHALVVLVFVVALAPIAAMLPLSALSAVLLVTAIKISEYKEVQKFIHAKGWQLTSVLVVTFALTVLTDLVIGVSVGLLLHLAYRTHGMLRGRRGDDGPISLSEQEAV